MKRLARPGPRSEAGFGMISLLVAVVLLAIAVTALSSSSAFLASVQTDASERSTAAAIAVAHMEEIKTRPSIALVSEGPVRVDATGAENEAGAFVRTLTVGPEPGVPNAVRATVRVRYPAGFGRTRTIELVTVIYKGSE